MITLLTATLAAIGFLAASLLALLGREASSRGRSYSTAVAAGILLALAFGDLFPEGLEMAERSAIVGFIGGFALLFLTETFTRAHTHHSPDENVRKHALGPFVVGLAVHNFADGFVLGITAKAATIAAGVVGFGVLIHQVPVGVSLAAVLIATHASRGEIIRIAVLLGLVIPLASGLTLALPVPGDRALSILLGVAGGVLAYVSAAHLLPEVQSERPSRVVGVIFAAALLITTVSLLTVLGE